MRVEDVLIEEIENVGCNNGNYPDFIVIFDNGKVAKGRTCRCGNGCSGMDQLPEIGQWFESINDFWEYSATQ